jgi:hypothetical protein
MVPSSRAPLLRGAVWLVFLACLCGPRAAVAAGAAVDAATPAQQQRAQELYNEGVGHFKAGRHADAAESFRKSYEVVASPNSHLMYARALRDAGKLVDAYEELALTQQEAGELAARLPKYASTGESAEAELLELRKRIAAISIDVRGDSPDVTVFVGTRQVPRERWRNVGLQPGNVDVSARLPGGRRAWQNIDARQGELVKVELDLSADAPPSAGGAPPGAVETSPETAGEQDTGPERTHTLRPWAYVAGGVGVVGLVTFGVFGAMSRSTHADLEDSCPDGVCPPERQDDIDKGKTQQTIANIGLAVGVIGLGTGVTLFVIDSKQSSGRSPRRLQVGAGPGSISVRGSF